MTKLSIIIPCYNCERTLGDAVDSVYRQTPAVPFDITMVDDGSTDRTFQVMTGLAAGHPGIRVLRHASNRGGGAARNTAVENSDGEIIFCLDSDDMLGPDFLKNMTQFWLEKRCDGLGISTSIKFRKSSIDDVAYVTEFRDPGKKVEFESLLDDGACSLYSTFLITREAFQKAGGYPTDHGFDTQGMAVRFLCNGLTAYTCPSAVYYHRVAFHQSYYMREERAGRNHWNMFRVFSEFLYLFRPEIQAQILDHEVFPAHAQELLNTQLKRAHQAQSVFRHGYERLLRIGRDEAAEYLLGSKEKYDQYWLGAYFLGKGKYEQALQHFVSALSEGFHHSIIYGQLLDAAIRLSGNMASATIVLRDLVYQVNDTSSSVESAAPPLPGYQRFENWLMRRGGARQLGTALKWTRLELRRIRGKA